MELSRDELRIVLVALLELERQAEGEDKTAIWELVQKVAGEAENRDREIRVQESLRRKGYRPLSAEEAAAVRAAWCQAPE